MCPLSLALFTRIATIDRNHTQPSVYLDNNYKMIEHFNLLFLRGTCFLKCRHGATAIEYALIASLIAVVIIGAVTMLGGNLSNSFDETADAVKTAK